MQKTKTASVDLLTLAAFPDGIRAGQLPIGPLRALPVPRGVLPVRAVGVRAGRAGFAVRPALVVRPAPVVRLAPPRGRVVVPAITASSVDSKSPCVALHGLYPAQLVMQTLFLRGTRI